MMPTIRIDDEVWKFLQSKARPFEDSPNDVLRRELGLGRSSNATSRSSFRAISEPGRIDLILPTSDYTNGTASGFELDGKKFTARTFKEILIGVCEFLRRQHADAFDKVAAGLCGKKRVYFSSNAKSLRSPFRIPQSNLFVETNLNANMIVAICTTLVKSLGHDLSRFRID